MKNVVFMGTPDFSVPILKQLLKDEYNVVLAVTQPDRPKGRKKELTPPPVKVEAIKHGIPVYQPEKVKDTYQEILAYNPDIIVTAAFGQILPKALLDVPQFGCINVHASLLPELRGGAPIHYSILQGKSETGITIMYMVEKLDAGDILSQTKVAIKHEDHVGSLHDKLAVAGAALLHDTMPNILNGTITPEEQDERLVTYAPNITREQEIVDWNNTSQMIYNHIRGLHPWPVASTKLKGKNLKIWWGEMIHSTYENAPGEIVAISEKAIIVCCGDGKGIALTEIQPAGKKKMNVADFIRGSGQSVKIGEKLGE
ncbi:methionyl-tRNA formyltransferase [Paraliobacillus quinghaiensis]|uniref:Methionyl-tRNA formyltransferase n=1 Tax=Paraliobacillus quinghaiensis TaxID=470815 RepID=A0A917WPF5_9BACI|nr:methionyl-tRNA formyltransferase [Paraliobacillus quinghaiensis]GGM21009.1 methionyl-tRNA formyltransferase [Paraliobacillus quinghaiensis]